MNYALPVHRWDKAQQSYYLAKKAAHAFLLSVMRVNLEKGMDSANSTNNVPNHYPHSKKESECLLKIFHKRALF